MEQSERVMLRYLEIRANALKYSYGDSAKDVVSQTPDPCFQYW